MSMRTKLTLSLCAIAIALLTSSFISIMEYSRMSDYVSSLIAANIKNIGVAQKLTEVSSQYNLDILAVIGDEEVSDIPDFRQQEFVNYCDSLRASTASNLISPLTDSVMYAYSAYMLTSLELSDVLKSDFIDTRTWYFERLQPQYQRRNDYIDSLSDAVYLELKKNSETFQRGFYRSIIPGIVAVAVGLLLVFLILLFILAYYVTPLKKMLSSLEGYRSYNKKYTYNFDGDDELLKLNEGITELSSENLQLRKRLKDLKSKVSDELEGNQP